MLVGNVDLEVVVEADIVVLIELVGIVVMDVEVVPVMVV